MLCYTYSHLHRLSVVCLRLLQLMDLASDPISAIHKFFALLEAGYPIPFFGDGSSGRDYTYVSDIVRGPCGARLRTSLHRPLTIRSL